MKNNTSNSNSIAKKFTIKKNSIAIKIFSIQLFILLFLYVFFSSSSLFLSKITAKNTLRTYGKILLSKYIKNSFDLDNYLKFLERPTIDNPAFSNSFNELTNFKNQSNSLFLYTVIIHEGKEVILIDTSENELFLPPGYILRDKPSKIVQKTYKKGKFIDSTYVNNSWGEYYSYYYPIHDRENNIVSLIGMDLEINTLNKIIVSEQRKILYFLTKFSIIMYGFSLILTAISVSKLTKPISSINNFLHKVSKGDLSEKYHYSVVSNEFSSIQNLFIDMIDNVKEILKSIISTSQEIDSTFSDVECKKTDIVLKINSINSLIYNISKSNEKIFLNTNNVKDEILAFNSSVNKINTDFFEMKEINSATQKSCIENTDALKTFIDEITPLFEKFENFKQNIEILNNLSKEIKQILTDIHEISNQTKLLSLNASIVAASAGEHGDGFAVVAKEIGDLSYKTSQSVSHIQDTLATIIKTITHINSETMLTSTIFKNHAEKSQLFSKNLTSINKIISQTSDSFEKVSVKANSLKNKNDEILTLIKYVNDESNSNNSDLKSISTSTNKLSELSGEFKTHFKKISTYMKNIRKSYGIFKIKKEE